MKELESYKEMTKDIDTFLKKNKSLMISKFIRLKFKNIRDIQGRGFLLKEITDHLSNDFKIDINYNSFWVLMNRHLKKISNHKKTIDKDFKEEVNLKNNIVEKEPITKKDESVSDEIKNAEKKPDLEWIKKPEFEHINRDQIIDVIIEYGITEQEVIDLKLPLYTLKCLDILINYGEKKKSKEIGKLYFGN